MRPIGTTVILLVLMCLLAALSQAQAPMPKPAPELKNLEYFAGAWTSEGDVKPGPMGPGGKFTGHDVNEWMPGGFFLTSHDKFSGVFGEGTGIAFMGYNPDDKVYTYDAFNSMGERESAKGTMDGDTWTYTSDEHFGGQLMKGRYSMKVLSPTSYNFKFEISQDGSNWTTVMDGKATKSK